MLKKALLGGAALIIGAMFMQGTATPASAGPNVKPNVKVAPKPRIRTVKPKIRLKVDPKRILTKKRENTPTDPTKQQAGTAEKATLPEAKVSADQVFQNLLRNFIEAATAAEAARNIKDFNPAIEGLVTVDPKEGPSGSGGGNTGDSSSGMIGGTGNNKNPIDMSPEEFADRFGASKTPGEAEAAGLADRFGAPSSGSSAVSDWSRSTGIAPDYTKIPTGGLASSETTRDTSGDATVTKTVNDDGSVQVTKTSEGGGAAVESTAFYDGNGEMQWSERTAAFNNGYRYTVFRDWYNFTATQTDSRGNLSQFFFDQETGGYLTPVNLDRTQTGEEQARSTLPPPSCGSAACNAIRRGLGIRSLSEGGIRSNPGPDGGTPDTQAPSVTTLINRDDLVKTDVAGDADNSQTNRTARELEDKGVRY